MTITTPLMVESIEETAIYTNGELNHIYNDSIYNE
jgi:hypothetical protein